MPSPIQVLRTAEHIGPALNMCAFDIADVMMLGLGQNGYGKGFQNNVSISTT